MKKAQQPRIFLDIIDAFTYPINIRDLAKSMSRFGSIMSGSFKLGFQIRFCQRALMDTRSTNQVRPFLKKRYFILCLCIQINMSIQEVWRQTKIFQTPVKCEGKVANLVINSGSVINFIKQKVLDKLHWPTEELLKLDKATRANCHSCDS